VESGECESVRVWRVESGVWRVESVSVESVESVKSGECESWSVECESVRVGVWRV